MATIALDTGKVVLKDGKASCTCCSPEPECICGTTTPTGIVLTEEEYNNFKQGGNCTMQINLLEGSCSSNLNQPILISQLCSFNATLSELKCSGPGLQANAFISVNWNVCREENGIYKMHYSGNGACPTLAFYGIQQCYSFGYFLNEDFDSNGVPPYLPWASIGKVTINNRGSQVEFNIYSFPFATADAEINVTPL